MDDIMLEETQNAANDKDTDNAAKPANRPKRRDGGRALKSINGSEAKIEGDVAVGGSIYASDVCIKQTNSDGTTEYVPLSDYVKQIVSAQQVVEPQVVFRRNAPRSNDSIGKIVAVAETVDEAKRVSYVATAEHVENFSTSNVQYTTAVQNATRVRKADVVEFVNRIDSVKAITLSGDIASAVNVGCSESVASAGTVSATPSVNATDMVRSAKSVYSAAGVENAGNVVRGITITAADFIARATNVEKAADVKTARNVGKVETIDGHAWRGPAIVPVSDCSDGSIKVSEWNTFYRSDVPFISLDGLARGWNDQKNELVFTVEIRQQYNVLYNISISADCDIEWIGEDGSNMKFDGDILIEFRVRVGKIFARLV